METTKEAAVNNTNATQKTQTDLPIFGYAFPFDCVQKLLHVRQTYEKTKGISLTSSTYQKTAAFFQSVGVTNYSKREEGIHFLETIQQFLTAQSLSTEQTCYILLIASLFIIHDVRQTYQLRSEKNATLVSILNDVFNLCSKNPLDLLTYQSAILSASSFITKPNVYTDLSKLFNTKKSTLFHSFFNFLNEETQNIAKIKKSTPDIAKTIGNMTGLGSKAIFYSVGLVGGGIVSQSDPLRQIKTAIISSAIYLLVPYGSFPMLILIPTVVSQLFITYCSVVCGYTMGELGEKMGHYTGYYLIGKPIELSYILAKLSANTVYDYVYPKSIPNIQGIDFINQQAIYNGKIIPLPFEKEGNITMKEGILSIQQSGKHEPMSNYLQKECEKRFETTSQSNTENNNSSYAF